MKLAVMQPYFMPYLGYFQLIQASDKFVFYDDVNFIKGGWINRNQILVNQSKKLFTVPLINSSSFVPINATMVNFQTYNTWKNKFLKTIAQSYSKAPYLEMVFPMINDILNISEPLNIGTLAINSIRKVCDYLQMEKEFLINSSDMTNINKEGRTERLIEMTKFLKCNVYINAIGGKSLYNKDDFLKAGISLKFVNSEPTQYSQLSSNFIANLSIIDVLMFNSIEKINQMIQDYELI